MPDEIAVVLGGFTLPIQRLSDLVEIPTGNESTNVTLGGVRYTDFVNNLRSWEIKFGFLCEDDYLSIKQVYFDQYNDEAYPTLEVERLSISAPVKMSISERDIRYNGDMILGFSIRLDEQYPVS